MHVQALELRDFRSYAELALELEPGVSIFLGPNGQGKTNLVEALGFSASQDSHRVASTAPLVRAGADRAVVRTRVHREGRELLIELELNPGRATRARLNRAPVARAREAVGLLRTVVFAPEDLALVKGDPQERRRFLDELLTARLPRYAGVRADYERVLRQRTTLLKSAAGARRGGDLNTLEVWDGHLARYGGDLLAGRLELLEQLRPVLDKSYGSVAGGGQATAGYRSTVQVAGVTDRVELSGLLAAELARRRPEELDRGVCLVGPHRDELLLGVGELPARGYASHGESWSLALALRLASYELLCGDGGPGAEPVLVLDDVFAELDEARRRRLAELVATAEQVLVTAAVAEDVPVLPAGARYAVQAGAVRRAG